MCVFLGYKDSQKVYLCYDSQAIKLYVSRYVVFLDHIPIYFISSDYHITRSLENSQILIILVLMMMFLVMIILRTAWLILLLLLIHISILSPWLPNNFPRMLIILLLLSFHFIRLVIVSLLNCLFFFYFTYFASFSSSLTSIHSFVITIPIKRLFFTSLVVNYDQRTFYFAQDKYLEINVFLLKNVLLGLVGYTKSKLSLLG